ncbi:cytochrome p450 [Hirsutella rhossiliensis]|uniref:Cytochrome p450 domain-containing protein n=1 Tax=Hirsutella rhossiliensis TaxID=111463 RepID=A0A9P8MN13_9HYPO|nr:cytochrome p450 domain-containing protein [Hirsutella rhossiliensis]KAH0958388.1 cytochrome p450 domain-containing protein [Hirsutella rhossiliensis]
MTPFDFVGVSTLSRILTELQVRLRPLVAATYRVLRSQSNLIRVHVSDCVNSLTASPLRNVPKAAGYPVLGILPQMCNQGLYTSTMTTLFELAQDCGLSCSSVGTIPIVYLRDPAIIRQVYAKNTDNITRFGQDGKGPFGINQRLIGYTAATADGEDWHRWRNGFLRDFNSPTALRDSHPGILRVAQRHAQKIIDGKSGHDLRKAMEAYALDTVWFIALGVDNVSDSAGDLVSALARYGDIVGNPSHLWRHALRNFIAGKSFRVPDRVEQDIRDDIETAVINLLSRNLGSGDSQRAPMTDDVLAQARQIFSLGHDASALALFWAIFELSRHPEVIHKLRRELRGKGCNADHVDFDTLRSMPYLDAVVTELFRLHPPISTTARRVTRPIIVETRDNDTVVLPRGTQLFSSVHLLHRDKQIWGETADDFRPERWLGVNTNSVQNRCEYLPFLAGPRACPSSGFVLLQVKMMLAVLLSRADIEIHNSSDVEKCIGGVIRPAKAVGYEVREVTL